MLLKRYNKCITAVGDYFEGDKSFMNVLSIKVPIRKKSGNSFNDPRNFKQGKGLLVSTIHIYICINVYIERVALLSRTTHECPTVQFKCEPLDNLHVGFVYNSEGLCRSSLTFWCTWWEKNTMPQILLNNIFEFIVFPSLRPVDLSKIKCPVFPTLLPIAGVISHKKVKSLIHYLNLVYQVNLLPTITFIPHALPIYIYIYTWK